MSAGKPESDLFKRKSTQNPLSDIAYIHISLNTSGIEEWLKAKGDITVEAGQRQLGYDLTHTVYWFLGSGIHYHKSCNQFSHTLSSIVTVSSDIGQIEWGAIENYFVVQLHPSGDIIFKCPLDEIQALIGHGSSPNSLIEKDDELVSVSWASESEGDHCNTVLLRRFGRYALVYRNGLVSLDFSIPSPSHVTFYDD